MSEIEQAIRPQSILLRFGPRVRNVELALLRRDRLRRHVTRELGQNKTWLSDNAEPNGLGLKLRASQFLYCGVSTIEQAALIKTTTAMANL